MARMASNSANCKTMSVAILSALLAYIGASKQDALVLVLPFPIVTLYLMDSYYLSIERGFRALYKSRLTSFQNQSLRREDYFVMEKVGDYLFLKALGSHSTVWFYLAELIVVCVVYKSGILIAVNDA